MLTVPQAAERVGRNPETVRRWIREGKLRARKVGTQHVIEDADLEAAFEKGEPLAVPEEWQRLPSGAPAPNWVAEIRRQRQSH